MSIRILLVEDHSIVREGLKSLLDKQPTIEVVGEADDGRKAIRLVKELLPNVVIMDVAMPHMNGIEATRLILKEAPNTKIIGLSMHLDRRFVVEMLKAGASGYLLKDCAFEELSNAIHSIIEDHIYLSPKVSDIIINDYVNLLSREEVSVFSILTPREREVLQFLAEGKTTREIASLINVSVKTIETYRQQIMNKLDIHSVAELTKYAIREGLTSLDT
jgi:DNA-binding NarL/FixJ family response regulator